MNNSVPARGFRAQQATGPGGSAPGVCTPGAENGAAAPVGTYDARPRPVPHPTFEPLEGRCLLSSVSLSGGVLQVTGDANVANHLVVQPSGSSNLFAYANNANKTVARSAVKSIRFTGGNRDDVIFLASTLPIDTVVNAGTGNDDIRVGAGNDVINGGDGNDMIWSRAGNDKVTGGNGDDKFAGDVGNDTFDGGAGNDNADGGGGDDAILGGAGNDTLIGNSGSDKLDGGDGNDALLGAAGSDTLLGGAGDDTLSGGTDSDYLDGGLGKNTYSDIKAEDKVPYGSSYGTPGGGNGNSGGGVVPVGITDNETVVVGKFIDSQTPKPVINLIGKTGTGPHTVHVHALASTLNGGDYLTARWQWDFGDPDGKYNQLEGFNAAHVYDNPGTYTLRLTITNENGRSNSVTTTVKVVADTRRTIYVDATAGRDTNSGLSSGAPIRTVGRALQLAASHTRILFKRGQRHVFDRGLSLPYQDVLVGAYGTGSRPVLWRNSVDGKGVSMIATYANSNQVMIQDLAFDTPFLPRGNEADKIGITAIYPRGVNITIRGCEFLNLDDAVNANSDPRGLLVQDNSAPLATGLRNYFIWSEGSDQVFLGNNAANSTREHNLRASNATRLLVAYNKFTNLDRSNVDPEDFSKGTVEIHGGSFAYVWRNELHDGALRVGPRGADTEPASVKNEWDVFDSNKLYEHDITVKVGTYHLMVRNNIVVTDTSAAITVETTDKWGRQDGDIRILNNTAVTHINNGRFLNLPSAGGAAGAITLKNNLWLVPKFAAGWRGSAPVFVYGASLNMFKEISNNVWPSPASYDNFSEGGMFYVWSYFSDKRGYKDPREWDAYGNVHDEHYENTAVLSDLTAKRGTIASLGGVAVDGVFADFYGRTRSRTGRISAGAAQTV